MRHVKFIRSRGIVSVYTLMMAGLFLTMGLAGLSLQIGSMRESMDIGRSQQARFLAQSAVAEARNYLAKNPAWVGSSPEQTVEIGGKTIGTYEYSLAAQGGNIYKLKGVGYIPNKAAATKETQSYEVLFRSPPSLVLFDEGFEANDLAVWAVAQDNPAHIVVATSNTSPKKGSFHARFYKTAASGNGTVNVASLTTPAMDLSPYDKVILRFSYRMMSNSGPAFRVYQNSTGNVGDWVEIFSDETTQTSSGYIKPSIQLSISPRTNVMRFRFQAEIRAKNEEWYLDAVQIATPFVFFDSTVDG